jgi:glucose-1-phosphate thymidylyltransferase
MKGVILAGGTGSRMHPLTKVTNKHLLPVYNEPMIFKVLKTLTKSGINEIVIVLGGESVGDFVRLLGDGAEFNAKLMYVYQRGAGGIAEALNLTYPIVHGDDVAVILGDNIFENTFEQEMAAFQKDKVNDCYLFLKEVPDPQRFGVAEVDKSGKIVSIEEKPKNPKSNLAVTGLYLYRQDIFQRIKNVIDSIGYSKRGELEITDVNNLYVKDGKVKAISVVGFWSDAGKFETLLKASNFIQSKEGSQPK